MFSCAELQSDSGSRGHQLELQRHRVSETQTLTSGAGICVTAPHTSLKILWFILDEDFFASGVTLAYMCV